MSNIQSHDSEQLRLKQKTELTPITPPPKEPVQKKSEPLPIEDVDLNIDFDKIDPESLLVVQAVMRLLVKLAQVTGDSAKAKGTLLKTFLDTQQAWLDKQRSVKNYTTAEFSHLLKEGMTPQQVSELVMNLNNTNNRFIDEIRMERGLVEDQAKAQQSSIQTTMLAHDEFYNTTSGLFLTLSTILSMMWR
jgi:hypothetical protein